MKLLAVKKISAKLPKGSVFEMQGARARALLAMKVATRLDEPAAAAPAPAPATSTPLDPPPADAPTATASRPRAHGRRVGATMLRSEAETA